MNLYLSENIRRSETVCKCGECNGMGTADAELILRLQGIRSDFERPIIFTSFYRCMPHNCRPQTESNSYGVSGAGSFEGSWHPVGGAADFFIKSVDIEIVYDHVCAKFPEKYGIGFYPDAGFIHLDIRPVPARWVN